MGQRACRQDFSLAVEHMEDFQELIVIDNGIWTMATNDPEQDLHSQLHFRILRALYERLDRVGLGVLRWRTAVGVIFEVAH